MTHIYFVRHALPNFDNHDDRARELTDQGLADRVLVTDFLVKKEISAVLSSPYKRAVDTVADFAQRYGYEVVTIEDFRERRVDSQWVQDFNAFAKMQWQDFDYKLSDGESLAQTQKRNIAALRHVLTKYVNQAVAIGSHGTAIGTILRYYLPSFGYDDFRRFQPKMPWIAEFVFEDERCVKIQGYDLFTGERECYYDKNDR